MRLARIRTADGFVSGKYDDGVVTADGKAYEVTPAQPLVAPTTPSACYCIGRNYAGTIEQMDYERPDQPSFFIKPPTAVIGPGASIPYPSFSETVTYAGELAAVIGDRARNLAEDIALSAVEGYTILNDVDALDQPSVTARKVFDGSGPVGPWIETNLDPTALDMHTTINGERRQEASTAAMLFSPAEIISFLSNRLTLEPGDIVSFGSPPNPGNIEPGDEIEIWYEGIGALRNTVEGPTR